MTILIDADGCPVVDITVKIAAEHKIDCVILCDTSHVFEKAGAKTITVSQGSDSVDFALVNMVQAGDIVVTQDYGLAAMCLARCAVPISQNGMVYTNDNDGYKVVPIEWVWEMLPTSSLWTHNHCLRKSFLPIAMICRYWRV